MTSTIVTSPSGRAEATQRVVTVGAWVFVGRVGCGVTIISRRLVLRKTSRRDMKAKRTRGREGAKKNRARVRIWRGRTRWPGDDLLEFQLRFCFRTLKSHSW